MKDPCTEKADHMPGKRGRRGGGFSLTSTGTDITLFPSQEDLKRWQNENLGGESVWNHGGQGERDEERKTTINDMIKSQEMTIGKKIYPLLMHWGTTEGKMRQGVPQGTIHRTAHLHPSERQGERGMSCS